MCSLTGCSDEACGDVSLAKVLSFCTCSEYPPSIGFDNPITVHFDSDTDWPLPIPTDPIYQILYNITTLRNRDYVVFGLLNHGGFESL